jgi:hypothetical protein
MKKLGMSLAVLFAAASFGWAQGAAPAPADKAAPAKAAAPAADAKAAPAKTKTHKVDAEVVSTDVEKKTITVKVEGAEKTAPVGPLAMYRLKKLKAGDKVVLTCKDDADTGEHKEISFIRMATPEAAPSAAPTEKKQ